MKVLIVDAKPIELSMGSDHVDFDKPCPFPTQMNPINPDDPLDPMQYTKEIITLPIRDFLVRNQVVRMVITPDAEKLLGIRDAGFQELADSYECCWERAETLENTINLLREDLVMSRKANEVLSIQTHRLKTQSLWAFIKMRFFGDEPETPPIPEKQTTCPNLMEDGETYWNVRIDA